MKIEIEPGLRLFVDVQGPEWVPDGPRLRQRPTLIVLHGGPGYDHSAFKPAFDALADLVQIVYYDHRGHGRSDPCPPSDWRLDVFADDVVRLCAALGIERPIVLGQSFGGFVAQRYLARHPAHPSKVILSSTSGAFNVERKIAAFAQRGGPEAGAATETFWRAPSEATWAPYRALCQPLYNTRPGDPDARARTLLNEPILHAWSAQEMPQMQLLPGLAQVQCPVLVLAGRDDPVCPLADSEDIHAALPAAWRSMAVIDDAGHGTWRDQPEATWPVLRRFISEPAPSVPAARA